MSTLLLVLLLTGLIISWYTIKLEHWIARAPNRKPFCDINDRVSCSQVVTGEYGKTFGIKNGYYGVLFYASMIVIAMLGYRDLIVALSICSIFVSLYLAYIQFFVVKRICILCIAIYIINIAVAVVSYYRI